MKFLNLLTRAIASTEGVVAIKDQVVQFTKRSRNSSCHVGIGADVEVQKITDGWRF